MPDSFDGLLFCSAMDGLEHDVLVLIAQNVPTCDLPDLRLVNWAWHSAVRDAQMRLRPHPELLQDHHLLQLCAAFPHATVLDLSECQQLTPGSLQALQALSHSLKSLSLEECEWVDTAATAHLGALSLLEVLDLSECPLLEALPDSLSSLLSLVSLNLCDCESLTSVESVSSLTTLSELSIDYCSKLISLPEGLSRLKSLNTLCTDDCGALRALPDGFSALSALQLLHLGCRRIAALPQGFCSLASLDCFWLQCAQLPGLPDGFGSLASLKCFGLAGCDRMEGLPASFSSLRRLEVRVKCMFNHWAYYSSSSCGQGAQGILISFHLALDLEIFDLEHMTSKMAIRGSVLYYTFCKAWVSVQQFYNLDQSRSMV